MGCIGSKEAVMAKKDEVVEKGTEAQEAVEHIQAAEGNMEKAQVAATEAQEMLGTSTETKEVAACVEKAEIEDPQDIACREKLEEIVKCSANKELDKSSVKSVSEIDFGDEVNTIPKKMPSMGAEDLKERQGSRLFVDEPIIPEPQYKEGDVLVGGAGAD